MPGFVHVPFNDLAALEKAIGPKTAGIILEPIQGEGGIRVASEDYLKAVRRICDEKKIVLIFDEVQTGMGRTGRMFGFQNLGVVPDAITLAKSLGGGFPIAAMVAAKPFADVLGPGTHASTFGGSPLACAAALGVFEAIEKEKLINNTVLMGAYLRRKLETLSRKHPVIRQVRGIGLMLGVELSIEGKEIYEECLKRKLLINCTQGHVLRLMPPMGVKKQEIDHAIRILDEVLDAQRSKELTKEGSHVA